MAIIGYARVSTNNQKLDSQIEALKNYGVSKIYKEFDSGRKPDRLILEKMLSELSSGDTLVIFKLDRLARGTQHLLALLEDFNKRNINFVSIQNHIDTTTPMGRLIFTIMSAFAEMEAELIRERVLAGLEAARIRGVKLGRPSHKDKIDKAIQLYLTTEQNITEITSICDVSITTLYRHLKEQKIPLRSLISS